MSTKTLPPNIKQPFKSGSWKESSPGKWTNRQGFSLTDLNGEGWRLCAPGGRFLADQLTLFKMDRPLTEWANEFIKGMKVA